MGIEVSASQADVHSPRTIIPNSSFFIGQMKCAARV